MRAERQEFLDAGRKRRVEQAKERVGELRVLTQGQVAAGRLTNREEWNWFLSIVQALRNEAQLNLAAASEREQSDTDFSPEHMAREKAARLVWAARVAVFDEVLDIPTKALRDGATAKKRLAEIEDSETESDS